jgi:long-chain acyl-CoA synthetase
MKINKINNLLELFYNQYQRQDKTSLFLQSLKEVENTYSWEDVYSNIIKLSEEILKMNKVNNTTMI